MSKTREVEGIYFWQDGKGVWRICIEEDKIEKIEDRFGVGYKQIEGEK